MKPIKRIILLAAMVSGIVIFWLVPNLDEAADTYYTRVYEDTDQKPEGSDASFLKVNMRRAEAHDSTGRRAKKVYKKERIHSSDKLSAVKPSKFSRAIHFNEEEVIVKEEDVVKEEGLIVAKDTAEERLQRQAMVKYLTRTSKPDSLRRQ